MSDSQGDKENPATSSLDTNKFPDTILTRDLSPQLDRTPHPTKVLTPADLHPDEDPNTWSDERKKQEEEDYNKRKDFHYNKMVEEVKEKGQKLNENIHDPVTDLLGRREFRERLELEYQRFLRNPAAKTGALALLDLDRFKIANDTYGHPFGDFVLRRVADVIRANIRKTDFAGRPGGDEFEIFFDATGEEDAEKIVQKIVRQIYALQLKSPSGEVVNIGATAGLAGLDLPESAGSSLKDLISNTDVALYVGKEKRGSVVAYSKRHPSS